MDLSNKQKIAIRKYVQSKNLEKKFTNILNLLGGDLDTAAQYIDIESLEPPKDYTEPIDPIDELLDEGRRLFRALAYVAAVELVKKQHKEGRITAKQYIKGKLGISPDMPKLYHTAGIRHPQESRNLRHNIFHIAFLKLMRILAPNADYSIPQIGSGYTLTPDLIVENRDPSWLLACEYKAYRSFFPLAESEILKGARYAKEFGTAWLISTSVKSPIDEYGEYITIKDLIENGIKRYKIILQRRPETKDQKELRGIVVKGLKHLEKHKNDLIKVRNIPLEALLDSIKNGIPEKGLTITTGMKFIELLREHGLHEDAEKVLMIMKTPNEKIEAPGLISTKLIDTIETN